jgi:hypothetical protein
MYSTVLANCKLVSIKLVRKNCFAFSLVPVVHLAWVHHRRHLDPPGSFEIKGANDVILILVITRKTSIFVIRTLIFLFSVLFSAFLSYLVELTTKMD